MQKLLMQLPANLRIDADRKDFFLHKLIIYFLATVEKKSRETYAQVMGPLLFLLKWQSGNPWDSIDS